MSFRVFLGNFFDSIPDRCDPITMCEQNRLKAFCPLSARKIIFIHVRSCSFWQVLLTRMLKWLGSREKKSNSTSNDLHFRWYGKFLPSILKRDHFSRVVACVHILHNKYLIFPLIPIVVFDPAQRQHRAHHE